VYLRLQAQQQTKLYNVDPQNCVIISITMNTSDSLVAYLANVSYPVQTCYYFEAYVSLLRLRSCSTPDPVSTGMGDRVRVQLPVPENLPRSNRLPRSTQHGYLRLQLVGTMSTRHGR